MDLAEGEAAHWIYEVQGVLRLDFKVDFITTEDTKATSILNVTRKANSFSYVAPSIGTLHLQWKNAFTMASERVLLFDWHKELPIIEPRLMFGGQSSATSHAPAPG